MNAGFDEYGLDYGIPPVVQVRYGFVVTDAEKFVGCISGLTHNEWFYISDLWLEKQFRRKGLGKQLLDRLETRVANENITGIYTYTGGHQAPAFYEKQGYEVFSELRNYYPGGHSRIGVRKNLALRKSG